MIASKPIEIEGKTYTHYSLSLAINGKYLSDGNLNGMIAATLTPTRIEDGVVEECTDPNYHRNVVIGSTLTTDAETQQVVGVIQSALQQWITSKGL